MRRGAHRRGVGVEDSDQIRLDFAAPEAATAGTVAVARPAAPMAVVLPLERRRPSPSAPVGRSAAEWFELGCELEASSPEEARLAYLRAIEADDRHGDAHLNLGRLLHETGDLAGAERGYRRALELEPDDATAAFNLGVLLEDRGRAAEAVASYEHAVENDPDFVDAYHNLVRLHEERGDKAAALRVLKLLRGRSR